MIIFNKKKLENKQKLIKEYELQLKNQRSLLEDKQRLIEKQEQSIERLIATNNDLIQWIYKIINEVGCYEVSKTDNIRIPLIKRDYEMVGGFNDLKYKREEIHIPAVTVIKNDL